MLDQVEATLSVTEAAEHFGVSPKTIRRWIKGGRVKGVPMKTPQGYEWRVHPDQVPVQVDNQVDTDGDQVDVQLDDQVVMAALALAEEVRSDKDRMWSDYQKLQQQNVELAGRCGYLQARLEATERQVLALTAPSEPEHPQAPWWKRMLGLSPAA